MPVEIIEPTIVDNDLGSQELSIDPREFYEAFRDVTGLLRHGVASVLHIQPNRLTAGSLPLIVNGGDPEAYFRKIDYVVGSDEMGNYFESCIQNGNYPAALQDEQT